LEDLKMLMTTVIEKSNQNYREFRKTGNFAFIQTALEDLNTTKDMYYNNDDFGFSLEFEEDLDFAEIHMKELAKGITSVQNMSSSDYEKLCVNSLIAANEFTFEKLTNNLIQLINGGHN
jgi:hypothetical protein